MIKRHLAVFAIVAVALGVCLGSMQEQSATGERSNAIITSVAHHAPASIHFDGILTVVAAAIVALTWAIERASRVRTFAPVATALIRRRGPPAFAN